VLKRVDTFARASIAIGSIAALTFGAVGCASPTTSGAGDSGLPSTKLQLAVFNSPQTPYGEAVQWFIDEAAVRSDGAIAIRPFWDGALLAGPDVLTGLSEGRADLGFSSQLYSPAELPLSQVTTVPFQTSDVVGVQNAFKELYESNEDYQAEWSRHNVTPLSVQGVAPMLLAGAEAPSGVDWLEGRQVRASGYAANAIQKAGGNAVALVVSEIYEAAQRGMIDGVASQNLGTVPSLSLQELMPHLADPGTGVYTGTYLAANSAKWKSLDPGVRDVLETLSAEFNDRYLDAVKSYDVKACDAFLEAGGSVTIWDESETERWSSLVGDELLNEWKASASRTGADADAFYEQYKQLLSVKYESDYVDGMSACAERSGK
jgi:TRAP-type C4-dicarboxylate transport system substrate-binding protein